MENSYKAPGSKKEKKASSGKSIFSFMDEKFSVEKVFETGLPIHYVPYVLYVAFIGVLYIGNTHYSDRVSRKFDQLKKEVEDLRADYTTLKADYMYESKQSEVEKKVKGLGLEEGTVPPKKIELEKEK